MSCIVIVATYSGNLIAFLTVSKETLPFSTFEEMAAQDSYKFGYLGGTAMEHYMQVGIMYANLCNILLHTWKLWGSCVNFQKKNILHFVEIILF